MIEATCSACGTHNRIAETDVPIGAKFVVCSSCKSRVALPGATKQAVPTLPKLPTVVPAIPSIKPPAKAAAGAKPPAIPVGPPSVSLGPAGARPIPVPASTSNPNEIIDLSDLPAPKRHSPLGATESKPAPRSGLAAASADADLLAPKSARPAGPPSLDLDDLLGPPGAGPAHDLVDLPAPKAKASADLLAPKVARPPAGPASVVPGGDTDLPAPKARSPIQRPVAHAAQPFSLDLDLRTAPAEISDLPAPKIQDLPAPKGFHDLPAPKGIQDLPTPKPGRAGATLPDLLQPKSRGGDDLLQPKPGQMPAGSIDLPAPKGGGVDLPAPKGFFEDLPQPARGQRSGASSSNEIAPKGFFEDLPQPARGQRSGPAQTDDIAPLGFFDDLPQPAKGQKPGPTQTDDIAPLGFFDDLPKPATIAPPPATHAPQPTRTKRDSRGAVDLGDDPIEQIDLANEAPQELELEPPPSAQQTGSNGSFDDLDLSAPSAAQGVRAQQLEESSPIKIGTPKTPGGKQPERASLPSLSRGGSGADQPLELEEPRETQSLAQRLGPKPQRSAAAQAKAPKKPVNRKLVLGLVLGLAAAGGGGFYFYQRHAAAQERQNTIDGELARARKALASDSASRWSTAAMAATKVLELEPKNGAAAGIFAEAQFALAIAEGEKYDARVGQARTKINNALGDGVTGPELDRASALGSITTNPSTAVTKLKALQAKAPKDPSLALYMGWAHAAAGTPLEAIKAYDVAAAAAATKLHALLGRGRVKLDQADLEGARADFTAALVVDKKNIVAQVGLAAALPVGQAQQQESDLLSIITAKEFKSADPRAKALAYILAGNAAQRTARLDGARERYRKALEIDSKALGAITGLAEVEITDGKREAAKTLIEQALAQSKEYPPALLAKALLALVEKRLDDADKIIAGLEKNKKLTTQQQIRVGVMRGRILDAQKKDEAALEAFVAAAKLAGDLDLTPTMAAIAKLTEMAKVAAAEKDIEREASLKARAEELLATLATAAEKDPSLAFTLGVAYQNAGEPALAEPWLQKVIAARPNDPDAMYQLAVVLRALGRGSEALTMLEKAEAAAPDRVDLALELARTYEAVGKDTEAGALYAKLLAPRTDGSTIDVPVELRVHAGLFFVRLRKFKEAGEQGRAIIKAARDNATGHYLVGEAALAAGNLEEARKEFIEAVAYERIARHLDAAGRANESISIAKKDMAMQDAAIRAYQDAVKLDPKMFSSQLGLGRLYVSRKEMEKAYPPLMAADKLKPNDPEVSYNMGAASIRLAKTAAEKKLALAWLLQAVRYEQTADTYNLIGDIYSMDGVDDGPAAANAYGKAVQSANQAAKKNNTPLPTWYPEALFQWGRRSLEIGDNATAKKAWDQWLGMTPPPPMNARRKEVERMLATTLRGP
ncbi:MAG: tetratricopeptide repeat protein [Kofleriaceae bacterium]